MNEKTLRTPVGCSGIALHSGIDVEMKLLPAKAGSGIVLRRTDIANGGSIIPVSWENIVSSNLATTIGNEHGVTVSTVEHLMAALAGCEIDNVVIEVDGPELPIMDGSAAPFVDLIEEAGIVEQDAPRRAIQILKPIKVGDAEKSLALIPSNGFSISFEIDFEASSIARQELAIVPVNGTFKSDIANARTFGFAEDVDRMRSAGLALGGSLDNAIVISGNQILNQGGLRHEDEFVRHKILDCVGDLYLAGAPIIGHVRGARSGHALNHELLRALFAQEESWCYTTLEEHSVLAEITGPVSEIGPEAGISLA
jgi:UDP-3-O-[3-hydroxymyristoyl] N-acetylglucosamine deacetylase